MWAIARHDFGLTSDEFWGAAKPTGGRTPGLQLWEFRLLMDRWRAELDTRFRLNGDLIAHLYNSNPWRGERAKRVKSSDIYPHLHQPQSPQDIKRVVRGFLGRA